MSANRELASGFGRLLVLRDATELEAVGVLGSRLWYWAMRALGLSSYVVRRLSTGEVGFAMWKSERLYFASFGDATKALLRE